MSLDAAGSIIAILQATKAVIDYLKDVKDAKEEKRVLLDELEQAHHLLETIKFFANPTTGQKYLDSTRDLISKGGLDLYKDSLDELQRLAKKNRFLWPFKGKDLAKHVSRVERAKTLFTLVIQGDQVKLASAILEEVQRVRETVRELEQTSRTDAERGILGWVGRSTPELDHERVAKARLRGTGRWLLERPEFVEWRQASTPRGLWAAGDPGVGKTILSSLVVDEFLDNELQSGAGVAYFYFDYTKKETHTADYLLRSVLRQLSALKTPLPKPLLDFHKVYSVRPVFSSVLASVLALVVQEFSAVYLVIDALDEFEEGPDRTELLDYLTTLAQNSLRLFVTSRPHPNDIKRRLSGLVRLDVEADPEDIRVFLNKTIENDPDALEIMEEDEGLKDEIVNILMERAKGMFLLPKLQVRGILQQQSSRDMRDALEELPDNLDIEFDRTWTRIQNQSKNRIELAEKTLTWLCFAKTTFRIEDIRDALGVKLEDTRLYTKGRPNSKSITNCCFGLVILDTANDVIRFVHYSVREYFKKYEALRFPFGQAHIARTCMTYLTFEEFAEPCTSRQALDKRLDQYPFLKYTACHWGYHCSRSEEDDTSNRAYDKIISDELVYESMLQALCSFDGSWGIDRDEAVNGYTSQISKYHFAAAFGLVTILLKLFESNDNDKTMHRDAQGRYPIHCAAAYGHESMITLLLGMGFADLGAVDNDGRTPFALATEAGHEGVIRLLLEEHGVKVDTKGRNGETPFALAAKGGHTAVVEMLLQRGSINLNSRQMFSGVTPLLEAAYYGHTEVMRVMSKHPGVLVDVIDSMRRTPLSIVAERNHVEAAQLLVTCPGVNLNSADMRGHTPLFHAAWAGAYEMVRFLASLPKIAVNQKSHMGETPLSIAARSGHDSCVRVLLQDDRTELNTRDFEKRSPLEHAVRNGHKNVVRLFIQDPRIELSTKNEWRRTPLDYAKRENYPEIAEMLEVAIEQRKSQITFRLMSLLQSNSQAIEALHAG